MTDPAPPAPPAPPGPAWHSTAPAELQGHWQVKGIDLTDPAKVALTMSEMHRNAELKLGIPSDQLVRWPKDANDEANWGVVRDRLGIPKDAKDYDFGIPKDPTSGVVKDKALDDALRAFAGTNKLPKDAAAALGAQVQKLFADKASSEAAVRTAAIEDGRKALAKEWQTTPEKLQESPFMAVAKSTASALKISPEALGALEGQIGYQAVMQLLHNIGTKIGEDKFITNTGPSGNKALMTVDQAREEVKLLKRDPQFSKRYLEGGFEEVRRMTGLLSIIAA